MNKTRRRKARARRRFSKLAEQARIARMLLDDHYNAARSIRRFAKRMETATFGIQQSLKDMDPERVAKAVEDELAGRCGMSRIQGEPDAAFRARIREQIAVKPLKVSESTVEFDIQIRVPSTMKEIIIK